MSLIGKLMGTSVKAVKSRIISSADVLAKKVKVNDYRIDPEKSLMFKSVRADEFIKSAKKQNAQIISDNVVYFEGYGLPHRVITKRLPSGTTVAEAYEPCGIRAYKEVRAIDGSKSLTHYTSASSGKRDKVWGFVYQDKTGAGKLAPAYYCYAKQVTPFPAVSKPDLRLIDYNAEKIAGMTEFSNANNANYQALKNMNLVK